MGMCTLDGDAREMAETASMLYEKGKQGDAEAKLNFLDVMRGINFNQDCSGHDKFVEDVYVGLSGSLDRDAVLRQGVRPGYPRLEEKVAVTEIYVPPFVTPRNDK
ncbi:MAG: hypothetical protein IT343_02765 [Candidatus Melainabacteria bacterium]|nr:hypothetical protein [Candidatus Melainabacteria bacterium]